MEDEDQLLTVAEASELTEISKDVLRDALRTGELSGRELGGSRGWITTRGALLKWAEHTADRLTVSEASELTGITKELLRGALKSGELAGEESGRGWITTRAALARWAESGNRKNDDDGTD